MSKLPIYLCTYVSPNEANTGDIWRVSCAAYWFRVTLGKNDFTQTLEANLMLSQHSCPERQKKTKSRNLDKSRKKNKNCAGYEELAWKSWNKRNRRLPEMCPICCLLVFSISFFFFWWCSSSTYGKRKKCFHLLDLPHHVQMCFLIN